MCGRYYINDNMKEELEKLVYELDKRIKNINFSGDVKPSMTAPVICHQDRHRRLDAFQWGFKKYGEKGLVINARAESIFAKRMFSNSIASRRCVIPASGFYEWDASRNKFHFSDSKKQILYMAGIYRVEENTRKFVIITTAANSSMKAVHDRMPVILQEDMLDSWLSDDSATRDILDAVPPQLNKYAELEQMRLGF